ncbi:ankyrin repeat-containing domain protein [Podospora didyma]|uniref:Ankyrin repeat-containing domain protein n=1 Tax=Podospora didyma TaxID=330526 RepID=A0AAE0NY15_9PEZI|nr:ankyrin repeat-containing domain protein [Podospora didyma]
MADPLSIITSVGGLLALTARTSRSLHTLFSELKNGPALIIGLSNEVADLSLVLDQVGNAKETFERLDPVVNAAFVTSLGSQLEKAGDVLSKLDDLTTSLAKRKRSMQRLKWTLHEGKATELKDKMRDVRRRIHEMITAHSSVMTSRIELQLRSVSTSVSDSNVFSGMQAHAISRVSTQLAGIHHKTDQHWQDTRLELQSLRRESIDTSLDISHRLSMIEKGMAVLLAQSNINHNNQHPESGAGGPQPNSPETLYFSACLTQARCPKNCPCRCHRPSQPDTSWNMMPGALKAAIGVLFVGYSGFPGTVGRSTCDSPLCSQGHTVRVQATYAFPSWFVLSSFHVFLEASLKGNFRFGLVHRRRVGFYPGKNIMYVTLSGSLEELKSILETDDRCVLDSDNQNGASALHKALVRNVFDVRKVELLLQHGADPDYEDDNGLSARHHAALRKIQGHCSPESLARIEEWFSLSSFIDDHLGLSYLHKIAVGMYPTKLSSALRKLESTMAPAAFQQLINAQDWFGSTALHYAAARGNATNIRSLLDAGARLDTANKMGSHPLHMVCRCFRSAHNRSTPETDNDDDDLRAAECFNMLISAGADVNQRDTKTRATCLHFVAAAGKLASAQTLIHRGAHLDLKGTITTSPPLLYAIGNGHSTLAAYLISQGADIEATDLSGSNAIHTAVAFNCHAIARLLLFQTPDTCNYLHVNRRGNTILHAAAASGDVETMRILSGDQQQEQQQGDLLAGLDPEARNAKGLTAAQVFSQRLVVSEPLREEFARLLAGLGVMVGQQQHSPCEK